MALPMRLGTIIRQIRHNPICGPRLGGSKPSLVADGFGAGTPLFFADQGMRYSSFAAGVSTRNLHSSSCLVQKSSRGCFVSPAAVRRLFFPRRSHSSKVSEEASELRRRYHPFGPYTLEEFKEAEGEKWLDAMYQQTMMGKFVMKAMRPFREYSEIVEESLKHPTYKYLVKGGGTFVSWVKYLVLISLGPFFKKVFDEFRQKTKNADVKLQSAVEMKRRIEEKDRELLEKDRKIEKIEWEAEIEKRDKQIEKLQGELSALRVAISLSSRNHPAASIQALHLKPDISGLSKPRKEDP